MKKNRVLINSISKDLDIHLPKSRYMDKNRILNYEVYDDKLNLDSSFKKYNDRVYNTLIISPPGYGKTTLIKKIIKYISKYKDLLVIDERGELYDKTINADYIRFSNKQYAFEKGIRVMSPQVIITDEIISENDFKICEFIANSGINIIATIHAKDSNEVVCKPYFNKDVFDRYIILNNKEIAGDILCIYDRHNKIIYE